MNRINDYTVYIEGMKRSLQDKLFWTEHIGRKEIDTVVDFGCADGSLLKEVHNINPDLKLIGIDNNDTMAAIVRNTKPFIKMKSDLRFVKETKNALLNLSSVIHEVYFYCAKEQVQVIWNCIFNSGYKYISIRDMMVSKSVNDMNEKSIHHKYLELGDKVDANQFCDFMKHIDIKNDEETFTTCFYRATDKDIIHFLLKYRYIENWEREVAENYLPLDLEDLLNKIIESNKYEIIYLRHYILPFIKEQVKKDFGIDIIDNTHCKILLRRKD